MEVQDLILGTEIKLNLNIDPIDGQSMSEYDWQVELYCTPKKSITIKKTDDGTNDTDKRVVSVDKNNYLLLIDTTELGAGTIMAKITAHLNDDQFPDKLRTEIVLIDTGITINK